MGFRTFTVTELITRVRQMSDTEHYDATNGFIDDTEIMGYLSDSYTELYDILLSKGIGAFETTTDFTGDGTQNYNLPSDFYSCLAVFRVEGDRLIPLREIQLQHIHHFTGSSTSQSSAYRLVQDEIHLYPTPGSGTYRMYYAPVATKFALVADTVDGINGWEEYIVLDTVIKCMQKEETNADHIIAKKSDMLDRIDAMSKNRVEGPPSVVDTESRHGSEDPASWSNDVFMGPRGW